MLYILIFLLIAVSLALGLLYKRYQRVKGYLIFREIIGLWSRGTNFKKNIYELNTYLINTLKLEYSSFFTWDEQNQVLQLIDSNISDKDIARNLAKIREYDHPGADFRDALAGHEVVWRYSKAVMNYPTAKMRRIRWACMVPLFFHTTLEGYWLIESEDPNFKLDEDLLIHLKELFGQNIGIGKQIYLDQLMQIPKREFGLEFISDLYKGNEEAVIALIDIDNFKRVNDTYGHDGGDYILWYVANILKSKIRPTDIVARYGGEEILLVLANCSLEDGFRKIDALRHEINQALFEPEGLPSFSVSVSAGLVPFAPDQSSDQLIKQADDRLYHAKRTGKNKVVWEVDHEQVG